jgi:hypothetical protein
MPEPLDLEPIRERYQEWEALSGDGNQGFAEGTAAMLLAGNDVPRLIAEIERLRKPDDWRARTCKTCGHVGLSHDAGECWAAVDNRQCPCGWSDFDAPADDQEPERWVTTVRVPLLDAPVETP